MGTLYRRGGRLWIGYVETNGRRVCRSTGLRAGCEAEARALLAKIESQVAAGESIARTSRMRLDEYAIGWHADRRKQGIGSAADEETRVRLHVLPTLGAMLLVEIKPRHVRELIRHLRTKMSARGKPLAPRTIRNTIAVLHRLLHDAVVDELIVSNPVTLKRGDLPAKVDADRTWRPTAVFERREIESIISNEIIPLDRRVMYAMLFLAGVRFGEAAALRVSSYDATVQPLGKLLVSSSYNVKTHQEKATKTGVTREVPVHPVLAKILGEWLLGGWAMMLGRPPKSDDLLIPSRLGRHRNVNHMLRRLHEDLERLGFRKRRQHDARRTFISLALGDGARKDVLRWITHGPSGDIVDMYTTLPWATRCEAVACLKIDLKRGEVIALPKSANSGGADRSVATVSATAETDHEDRNAEAPRSLSLLGAS